MRKSEVEQEVLEKKEKSVPFVIEEDGNAYPGEYGLGWLAPLKKRKKGKTRFSCHLDQWESCRESFLFRWLERVTRPEKEYSPNYFALAVDGTRGEKANYNFNKLTKLMLVIENVLNVPSSDRITFYRDRQLGRVIVQPKPWWKLCNARMSLLTILLRGAIGEHNTIEKVEEIFPNGKIADLDLFVNYLSTLHPYLRYTVDALRVFFSGKNYMSDADFGNIAHWVKQLSYNRSIPVSENATRQIEDYNKTISSRINKFTDVIPNNEQM